MPFRPRREGMIALDRDFEDLLVELYDAGVEFVIIGGRAEHPDP